MQNIPANAPSNQLSGVYCVGMGQEAMTRTFPKIKEFIDNSSGLKKKGINKDFDHIVTQVPNANVKGNNIGTSTSFISENYADGAVANGQQLDSTQYLQTNANEPK